MHQNTADLGEVKCLFPRNGSAIETPVRSIFDLGEVALLEKR